MSDKAEKVSDKTLKMAICLTKMGVCLTLFGHFYLGENGQRRDDFVEKFLSDSFWSKKVGFWSLLGDKSGQKVSDKSAKNGLKRA